MTSACNRVGIETYKDLLSVTAFSSDLKQVILRLKEMGVVDFSDALPVLEGLISRGESLEKTLEIKPVVEIEDFLPVDGSFSVNVKVPGMKTFQVPVTNQVIGVIKDLRKQGLRTAKNLEPSAFSDEQHMLMVYWGKQIGFQFENQLKLNGAGEMFRLKSEYQSFVDRLIACVVL